MRKASLVPKNFPISSINFCHALALKALLSSIPPFYPVWVCYPDYSLNLNKKEPLVFAKSSFLFTSLRNLWSATLLGEWRRENAFKFFARECFDFEKFLRNRIKFLSIFGQPFLCDLVRLIHELGDFRIDLFSDRFRVIALLRNFAAKENQLLFLTVSH